MNGIPDITQKKKKKENSFFDGDVGLQYLKSKQPDISVPTESPNSRRTPDDILKDIFSYRPPAPIYDKNRPEELKRLAKISAIGKGINLLGDVISLSAGGNVRPRPKDERELGYLQSMYNYIDEYNRRKDEYNWQDYVQKLKTGELALSEASKRKERELREKMQESEFAQREKEKKEDFEREKELMSEKEKIEQGLISERTKGAIKEIEARGEYYDGRDTTKTKDNKIQIKTSDGKIYEYTPVEISQLRDRALQHAEEIEKEYPYLFEKEFAKDELGNNIPDKYIYRPSRDASDEDFVRAYIQMMNKFEQTKNIGGGRDWISNYLSRPEYKIPMRPFDYNKLFKK